MIVGFCGLPQVGKDTASDYLVEHHGFERLSIFRPGKEFFCSVFGLDLDWVEEHKDDPNVRIHIYNGYEDLGFLTIREALQKIGEHARRLWGDNFWLDQALPKGIYDGKRIVLTDVRYSNEAKRVKDCGGHVVLMLRRGTDTANMHISNRVDFLEPYIDNRLSNNYSLGELYHNLDAMVERYTFADEGNST